MNKSLVYVSFPKTGLGNLLLVWSRARLFSHLNGLPLVTSSWWGIRWGSWLRNENRKRLYYGYFRESSLVDKLKVVAFKGLAEVVQEPVLKKENNNKKKVLYRFSSVVTQDSLFGEIQPYREFIKAELYRMIHQNLLSALACYEKPVMAVHIRRGDFKYGNPLTSEEFFIRCIRFVRTTIKQELPVTVFTDADPSEIRQVMALNNIRLAEKKPDILDMLLLSQSRVMVLSQSSTFSYWAAFLSDAIVIRPEGDWQKQIRPDAVNKHKFEGMVAIDDPSSLVRLSFALEKEEW
ncbi:hypothetical protein HRH25_09910 [Flavisolibacter sp. BT320]|nr:hypothetical protein [Flavisolibacter longurius]